jgi:hypothetical protein
MRQKLLELRSSLVKVDARINFVDATKAIKVNGVKLAYTEVYARQKLVSLRLLLRRFLLYNVKLASTFTKASTLLM